MLQYNESRNAFIEALESQAIVDFIVMPAITLDQSEVKLRVRLTTLDDG